MAENKFDTTVASLFKGMDGFYQPRRLLENLLQLMTQLFTVS